MRTPTTCSTCATFNRRLGGGFCPFWGCDKDPLDAACAVPTSRVRPLLRPPFIRRYGSLLLILAIGTAAIARDPGRSNHDPIRRGDERRIAA